MALGDKLAELRQLNLNYFDLYGELYEVYADSVIPKELYERKLEVIEENYKKDLELIDLKYAAEYETEKFRLQTRKAILAPARRFIFFKNTTMKNIEREIALEAQTQFMEQDLDYNEKYEDFENRYFADEPEVEEAQAGDGKPTADAANAADGQKNGATPT